MGLRRTTRWGWWSTTWRGAAILACVALVGTASSEPAKGATTVPSGFSDQLVASVPAPSAFDFLPDGRIVVATLPGIVRVIDHGQLLPQPALDLSPVVCDNSERGLLGLAVDPHFADNGFVYVYYTYTSTGACGTDDPTNPVNRVSRFRFNTKRNTISPQSELVLLDDIPSFHGNHDGGDVEFDSAGQLLVSVGDGGCDYAGGGCGTANDAARDMNVLLGKVLRITTRGGIPADNPYRGPGTVRCAFAGTSTPSGLVCRETFLSGLRNPFRIAVDPAIGRVFVNDVGAQSWEEVNLAAPGADYGWNVREGPCALGSTTDCGAPPAGLTDPIYAYDHDTGCVAITGGAFVPSGAWGPDYDGDYLFADNRCRMLFRLEQGADGSWAATTWAQLASPPVHLRFGPSANGPALYYSVLAPNPGIHRIELVPAV